MAKKLLFELLDHKFPLFFELNKEIESPEQNVGFPELVINGAVGFLKISTNELTIQPLLSV